jgi:hypothetical protein
MAYTKLSVDKILQAQPEIGVLDLATEAVADHCAENGCVFEPDAPVRAINEMRLPPNTRAADLDLDALVELSELLESMETSCPHKPLVP